MEWDDGNENKPTVAVIAQDPKQGQDYEKLVIGTPFGLHHKGSREKLKLTKLYFDMLQDLLDLGYRVYLTDIWKMWVCNPENPYKSKTLPKVDQQNFLELLKPELEAIQSIAIITWGKPASNPIKSLNLETKHLEFPHPSGANGDTWKKLIGSATAEDKRDYWRKVITQELG
jgi:hypothetical protein